MAVEAWITRTKLGHLVPATAQDAEALQSVPVGEWRLAKIRLPRNVKHHRKYFALLQAVFPHQTMYPTFRRFRAKFEEALGHGEYHIDGQGKRYFENESINFGAMDQDEFEQFYARAKDLILTRILPGADNVGLDRLVHDILEGRKAA